MSQACVIFFLRQTKASFPGVHISYSFLCVDFAKYSGRSHYSHCCKQPTLVTTTNMKPSFCFQVITFIVDGFGGLSKDILDSDKLYLQPHFPMWLFRKALTVHENVVYPLKRLYCHFIVECVLSFS